MAQALPLPLFEDEVSIGPAFFMPDLDGISDVRKYLEEKTDAQCNFAGCGLRPNATIGTNDTPSRFWEEDNHLNTPNVPTTDGLPLEDDLSNAIDCYICGFPIDGRRGVALDIQNTWGGQCEHVMAVAALAAFCGLAGENYEKIVKRFLTECGINGEEYTEWRNRLVKQSGPNSGQNNEGGGPKGILYKWAHPGCNEIKGNNPYLRINFKAIAEREDNWFQRFTTGANLGGGGRKMIGGDDDDDIYCEGVIKWNLACMCGVNKGNKKKFPDGGKKSMYWRKRYKLYMEKGVTNMNIYDDVKSGLGEKIINASKLFYRTKNKVEKRKAAAALKKIQRNLIKDDNALQTIELRKSGEDGGREKTAVPPGEWIDGRFDEIKSQVLEPIVKNMVKGSKGATLDSEKLRRFICISQCILTRIFEENLTSAVAKLEPDNFENWSYAPASKLASDIVNLAFKEIKESGNKNFTKIYEKYADRLKQIPRTVKGLKDQIKGEVKEGLKKAKAAVKVKKQAVKKAVVSTGAKIKKALPKKKPQKKTGGSQKTIKKGGCRTCKKERKRKTIKRSRIFGGNRELIPYRLAIFTSKKEKMKSILSGRRFRIYRDYLAPYSRLTKLGNSRIMRWLSLLLSDLDIEDDLLNNYSFELKLMEEEPYPVICAINVLCEKIQTAPPTEIEDYLLLELYNKGKIFKENDDIYNLGMYKYLTALTLSDRIPSLLDELIHAFELKLRAQLEIRGEEMIGRAPVQEKDRVRLYNVEGPERVFVKSSTASKATSKRTKKKGKKRKHKKKISGGNGNIYQKPSYEGLIMSHNVINLNGTNFLSNYVTTSLLQANGEYSKELITTKKRWWEWWSGIGLKDYEYSFFDIIKTPESTDDYQDDKAYKEISHANNDGEFGSDPIFKLFGEGKREIEEKGRKIREKWGKAELQWDERNTRIFYILGMIDYLSGIDIYSYDGNGKDPVEEYLEGLESGTTHRIVHSVSDTEESQYSTAVQTRADKLLSGIVKAKLIPLIIDKEKEKAKHTSTQTLSDLKKRARKLGVDEGRINEADDDCEKLLSYFGMSYGPNSDKVDTDDTIYETIKLTGTDKYKNMVNNIRKFVLNVTMVNVMTYPYIRCYVNYDPVYKRYMWIYDPIMDLSHLEDDNGYGRNFCRTTRRYQSVWSDGDIHTSMNPYAFAYE